MLHIGDMAPSFTARPVSGLRVELPGDAAKAPAVIVFVPALGSPAARRALFALQDIHADLDRLGARVVAITPSDLPLARDFVPRHHLLFPLVVDPTGRLRDQYGVGLDRWLLGTVRAGLGALSLRHGVGRLDASARALGAEFVVGTDGRLLHARYPRSVFAAPDLKELVRCVRQA